MVNIQNYKIVLFDGVCNLCNVSVQFIIKRDKKGKFRFASLQSEFGKKQIEKYKIDILKSDSVIYIANNKAYMQSSAALRIVKQLDGFWPVLFFFVVVPPFIRNSLYNFVAKNRYRWFGKKDLCMVPDSELKSRFLG